MKYQGHAPVSMRYARPWDSRHTYIKAVCLGGGHGLHATLEAMRLLTPDVTAIVCVGDNGGSSGRLREEFPGILPPGDIRMALSALVSEQSQRRGVVQFLQHRFRSHGPLNGHSLGNLILAAQWQRKQNDMLSAIRSVQNILGIDGTVIPGAHVPLDLTAQVRMTDGSVETLHGQRTIAKAGAQVLSLSISPVDPPIFPAAVQAIHDADVITLGPGSWYTSLLVHLLVPQLRDALHASHAKKILIMDLKQDSETTGMTEESELTTFEQYSHHLPLDAIVTGSSASPLTSPTTHKAEDRSASDLSGTHRPLVVRRKLNVVGQPGVHDRVRLAAALTDAFEKLLNASR
jgi:uncharacterized cofD-like protein